MITSICLICFQEIIDNLDQETLVKVAKEGFMSRPLVLKDIIEKIKENSEGTTQPVNLPPFCVCGSCQEMMTEKERICCRERRLCRSKSLAFQNICLDSDNLATVIRSLADTYVFTPTYDNRAMRHAASTVCHVDSWTFRERASQSDSIMLCVEDKKSVLTRCSSP